MQLGGRNEPISRRLSGITPSCPIGFFVTFLSLVKFQLGRGRTPCPPPLDYAYAPSEENKIGLRKFSARFLAFSNEI